MNRVNQLLAVLVSLLFVGLVLEGGLRLIGFTPRRTMNQFDSTLGWTKAPSTSLRRHTSEFDVTLRTNSRGLREDESVGYEKPAGVTRILLVGDSFTLGYTVERPDTLSQLLAERMRSEGRNVQVINGGTEGYSTDQEVVWLMTEGVKYAPDVVVLQMFENDIYWNGQSSYLRYPKPKLRGDLPPRIALKGLETLYDPGQEPWLERNTALGNMLGGVFAAPQVPMLSGPRPLPAEWAVRIRDVESDGWAETKVALSAFRIVAEDMGAKPLVVVIPEKAQVDPAARRRSPTPSAIPRTIPTARTAAWSRAAKAAGLTVVAPQAAMLAAARGRRAPALLRARLAHQRGGNRVLAKEIDAALASPQFLGPPPHEAPPLALPASAEHPSTLWRNVGDRGRDLADPRHAVRTALPRGGRAQSYARSRG